VQLINPMLRGWVNYFAVGHSSGCFRLLEHGVLGGGFIEMKRLSIELACEADDVVMGDQVLAGRKAHADLEVVEPLDHAGPVLR
jgi:hypothetical protein